MQAYMSCLRHVNERHQYLDLPRSSSTPASDGPRSDLRVIRKEYLVLQLLQLNIMPSIIVADVSCYECSMYGSAAGTHILHVGNRRDSPTPPTAVRSHEPQRGTASSESGSLLGLDHPPEPRKVGFSHPFTHSFKLRPSPELKIAESSFI